MSVFIHILSGLALFRLLWRIKPNLLALFGSLLFVTTPVLAGAVLYENINGYQLFTTLMLTGIYYAYNFVKDRKTKDLVWCGVSVFVSGFFYEMGVVVAFMLLVYMVWETRDKRLWFYSSTIIVYTVMFVISVFNNPLANLEGSRLLDPQNLLNGLNNSYVIAIRWFCEICLPMAFYFIPLPQVMYQPLATGDRFTIWIVAVNLVFLAILVYAIMSDKTRKQKLVYILSALSVIYILIISLVRSGILGEGYITSTNFDTYMLMAWIVPIVYMLLCNTSKLGYKLALVGMACFIIIGGYRVFTANHQLSELEKPQKSYLAQIDRFVSEHQTEKGFSFRCNANELDDYLTMKFLYKDELKEFSVPQIIYYNYWSDNPMYNLEWVDGELIEK
jgi:hypothetical protein